MFALIKTSFFLRFLTLIIIFSFNLIASDLINAGPMVGYSKKREVALWIQTTKSVDVAFKYWNIKNPSKTYLTSIKRTIKDNGFTATLIADQLEPGQVYNYEPVINNDSIIFDFASGDSFSDTNKSSGI